MKTSIFRHRIAVGLFVACLVFLVGGGLLVRALADPETRVFPANGHLALDYISGNRAYSVWHQKSGSATCALTFRNDGSTIAGVPDSNPVAGPAGYPHLVAQYDLRKEGGYDFRFSGEPGDTAALVRENGFIWVIPAMLSGMLAFLCFIGGVFAVFVVNKRR